MTRTHSTYFKDIRNTRLERYASETNKLLIRLDKLLNNLPTDPTDKKGAIGVVKEFQNLCFIIFHFLCNQSLMFQFMNVPSCLG